MLYCIYLVIYCQNHTIRRLRINKSRLNIFDILLLDDFFAAHIRSECFGDIDAAVLVEIVFQERYQHSGRSDHGVVESVGEVFAVFAAVYSDFQTARLSVS